MRLKFNHFIFLIFLFHIMVYIIGCTIIKPSKPNTPFAGPYPNKFSEIAQKNPLLFDEIGKLPEIQDGISMSDEQALECLCNLYNKDSDNFNRNFDEMYKIGIPKTRKYCAPLQALYWLAEKQDTIELKKYLQFGRTKTLLSNAWDFQGDKWADASKVIDRLNSPGLFEYWFAHNFTYDWSKFWITTPTAYPQSAETTIETKKGICFDAAYLAYKCLKQAGYDATGLNVYFGDRARSGAIMHSVCIIKREYLNRIRYFKLADTNSPGFIDGPYDSINEIAERVARMHGVKLGRFLTGSPYYNYSYFRGYL